jgi:hypothetical protein
VGFIVGEPVEKKFWAEQKMAIFVLSLLFPIIGAQDHGWVNACDLMKADNNVRWESSSTPEANRVRVVVHSLADAFTFDWCEGDE